MLEVGVGVVVEVEHMASERLDDECKSERLYSGRAVAIDAASVKARGARSKCEECLTAWKFGKIRWFYRYAGWTVPHQDKPNNFP
eukprot:1517222-Prymnesium_polylepis.1